MEPPDAYPDLNAAQRQAVEHGTGPILIVAGAGTGKTKTLVCRIGRLIQNGVRPEKILAITFTNKAANEMAERVTALLGAKARPAGRPWLGTFHALGAELLRQHRRPAGLAASRFTIWDKEDSLTAVREATLAEGFDPRQFEPRRILSAISRQKSQLVIARDYDGATGYWPAVVKKIWQRYELIRQKQTALDFDDLILETVRLLQKNEAVLKRAQERWEHLLVDEYQDTNHAQYVFARLLAAAHRNLCVVGDADQSIYSWRGADFTNLLRFEEDYPDAKVVVLEENYRSSQTILAAADAVIAKNLRRRPKTMFTQNPPGAKITLIASLDEAGEAAEIAEECRRLIALGTKPEELAVLYRTNFQSRALEEAMLEADVPYRVWGTRFLERKEVKDVLALIKAALNPEDILSAKRIINLPPRGIGKATAAKIFSGGEAGLPAPTSQRVKEWRRLLSDIKTAATTMPPSALVKFAIRRSGLEEMLKEGGAEDAERLANIRELASIALRYDAAPPAEATNRFLAETALSSGEDSAEAANSVSLMTVHAAKGLEFKRVFVSGLEQDLFPQPSRAGEANRDPEEERRLFYVAITRAKEKIYLSYAQTRLIFGSRQSNLPSEFILDLEERWLEPAAAGETIAF